MKIELAEKINFDDIGNHRLPIDIMIEIMMECNKVLKGFVNVNVYEYSGEIENYTYENALSTALKNMVGSYQVDIQDKLGELSDNYSKYEIIFTSDYLENYKYRLMFVGHGISGYPVRLVLESGLAESITGNENDYILDIDSPEVFETRLVTIFSSDYVTSIFQEIIDASKRRNTSSADIEKSVNDIKVE